MNRWLRSFGLTGVLRNPAASGLAILVTATGVGLVAAAFSVLSGVVPRALPGAHGDRIVAFSTRSAPMFGVSLEDYEDFKAGTRTLDEVGGFQTLNGVVTPGEGRSSGMTISYVTPNLFELLGVEPLFGRGLRASDEDMTNDAPVVLSYGLWQSRFGGREDVLGEVVLLNREALTVVGVMPKGFKFPIRQDAWSVAHREGRGWQGQGYFTVGRLAEDASLAAAREELKALSARLDETRPLDKPREVAIDSYVSAASPPGIERALRAMFLASLLVWLVASANLGSLRLIDVLDRRSDLMVRRALGATSTRLLREVSVSSAWLVTLGCALGLALAMVLVATARNFLVAGGAMTRAYWVDISLQPEAVLVAIAAAGLAALLGGVVPAWLTVRGVQSNLNTRLTHRRSNSMTRVLVGTQLWACAVLLVLVGALGLSAWRLLDRPQNFDTTNVVYGYLSTYQADFEGAEQARAFRDQLLGALGAHPEIEVASFGGIPDNGSLVPVGDPASMGADIATWPSARVAWGGILPESLDALRRPILSGRTLGTVPLGNATKDERRARVREAVVSQSLADALGGEVIGRQLEVHLQGRGNPVRTRVVGIMADAGDKERARSGVEWPQSELLFDMDPGEAGSLLLVRGRYGTQGLNELIQTEVERANRLVATQEIAPLANFFAEQTWTERRLAQLFGLLALAAVLLSAIGLWAVLSRLVAIRRRELGIRSALGATPRNLRTLMIREATWLWFLAGGLAIFAIALLGERLTPYLFRTSGARTGSPCSRACSARSRGVVGFIVAGAGCRSRRTQRSAARGITVPGRTKTRVCRA